jgi:hypothetical protein
VSECVFKEVPEYMKNIIDKETTSGEELNPFLEFNSSKSLAARLYQKNKKLMENAFNEDRNKRDSLLAFLDS